MGASAPAGRSRDGDKVEEVFSRRPAWLTAATGRGTLLVMMEDLLCDALADGVVVNIDVAADAMPRR